MIKKKTSKFLREYKMTLQEMRDKYGFSFTYLRELHIKGELHQFIAEQESQREKVAENK